MSFWTHAPRENFADLCCQVFGQSFDAKGAAPIATADVKPKAARPYQVSHTFQTIKESRVRSARAARVKCVGDQLSARAMAQSAGMVGRALMLLAMLGWATAAAAGPISGCVTELPSIFSFTSPYQLQIGAWEQQKGCDASGPQARPTGGPYSRSFFDDGSQGVTFSASGFNPGCSTQIDLREIDNAGNVVGYHDFIYNPPGPDTCFELAPILNPGGGDNGGGGDTGGSGGSGGGGGGGDDGPVNPPNPFHPPVDATPVPEPATLMLTAAGLAYLARKRVTR